MADKKSAVKAGRLLSKFIRIIAAEETEVILDDNGEDRMATKAEALARQMWKMATGFTEEIETLDGTKEVTHPPDTKMMSLLMDRIEGKAPNAVVDSDTRPSIAQKIDEQSRKRIASIGELDD